MYLIHNKFILAIEFILALGKTKSGMINNAGNDSYKIIEKDKREQMMQTLILYRKAQERNTQ